MKPNCVAGARVIPLERRAHFGRALGELREGDYPIPFATDSGGEGVALLRVRSEHRLLELPLDEPQVRLTAVLDDEAGAFDAGFVRMSRSGSCEIGVHGSLRFQDGRLTLRARVEGVSSTACGRTRQLATELAGDATSSPLLA